MFFSLNTSEYISVCSNDWVDFIGDGYCDDEVNTEACLYDLGDCCDFHSISQSLCIECFCYVDHISLLASITQCSPELLGELIDKWENLGNGQCNNELNSLDNLFDAGDCCYDPEEIHQCIDSNVFCNPDTLGDGKCQDYNNGPKCDFDLGDCCSLDANYNVNGTQCCYCQCHDLNHDYEYWLENGWLMTG